MPVEQMNPSSEGNTLDRDHLIVQHVDNLIALDLGHLYLVFAVEEAFSSLEVLILAKFISALCKMLN